jgi:hypothetical protein
VQLQHQEGNHQSIADLDGLKLYTFPTAGRFLAKFGVVPVTIPYEDAEVAVQTGELDGMSWSGITEDYTVGWADVTDYFLTNNISGAWIGSWFANQERWNELPDHLKQLSWRHGSRPHIPQPVVLGRRSKLRATGDKLQLRSVPAEEWAAGRRRRQGLLGRDRRRRRDQGKGRLDLQANTTSVINQAGFPYTKADRRAFDPPHSRAPGRFRGPAHQFRKAIRRLNGSWGLRRISPHAGNLTFELKKSAAGGSIDTVLVCWWTCRAG